MVPRNTLRSAIVACALCAITAAQAPAPTPTKLLRFPDVHADKVAFCYAGDLWLCPSTGGTATRLTAHAGLELFPRFSPDGKWIAFTGQYDGDEQVYVIPAGGGVPRQLTWYPARGPLTARWGYDNQVYGWTKDSQRVLFRSMREGWDLTDTRLYTVSIAGGAPEVLPMPVSGGGDLSPDEKKIVYSPLTRDFRTWKRYQGGWAQDLFIFDLATHELAPVASHVRTERDPMWIGDKIYFASDRTGTLNLYGFDPRSGETEQLTQSKTWDVRWPSKGDNGEIVHEYDGELWILDTQRRAHKKIDIVVPDDGLASRPSRIAVANAIESVALAPKGERAVFTARGDVFSVPIEKGPTRNLTRTSGVHDRGAEWSPDGAKIAFISDQTGEDELWLVAQDGSSAPEQLTRGGDRRLNGLRWAPNSERIAFNDKSNRLRVVDVASKTVTDVARNAGGGLGDYNWAPDSAWLAFSLTDANGFRSLYIWGGSDSALHRVTDELFNEFEPVFDPAGKYLYYFADREFAPQLTGLEWNFCANRTTSIFALALRKDVKHPFPPESDEVKLADAKKDGEKKDGDQGADEKKTDEKGADGKKDGDDKSAKPEPLVIDFDGLAGRVTRVPVEADNYQGLSANKEHLFFAKSGAPFYGRDNGVHTKLMAFAFEKREATELVEDMSGYTLCSDGSKVLVNTQGSYALYDAKAGAKDSKKVSTGEMFVDRVPREEWNEAFSEVWRRFRDYFYVDNMHGYDWNALREQYASLLPYVGHRADLNYVIGEMIAELNIGHAYNSGGDYEVPPRPRVALLGAQLELDKTAGRYKLAKILRGQNEEERYRSPLTEVGVDVKPGEYLLAIDGEDLPGNVDPYKLLRNKADRPVELLIGASAAKSAARKVVINPISSETELRYLDFVLTNRERVERLSGGRFGYVHVPDMGPDGIREFIKWYYGQVRKDALIIDDRNNGGGNVSQMLIERLRRTLLGTGYARENDFTDTYPSVVFTGPMVCLLNENSASDGDIFPWMFRESKLGLLIGKRSWGGVVGITDHGPLIDGGSVNVPEFGNADARGQWAVEGHGVDPDIVVENDAKSVLDGRDPQLERAVEELEKQLAAKPAALPKRPAAPVKTK